MTAGCRRRAQRAGRRRVEARAAEAGGEGPRRGQEGQPPRAGTCQPSLGAALRLRGGSLTQSLSRWTT